MYTVVTLFNFILSDNSPASSGTHQAQVLVVLLSIYLYVLDFAELENIYKFKEGKV